MTSDLLKQKQVKKKGKKLTFRRHRNAAMLKKRGNIHIMYNYNVYC